MISNLGESDDEEDFLNLVSGISLAGVSVSGMGDDNIESRTVAQSCVYNLDFKCALDDFYSVYNVGNMSKVSYLALKFTARRWELWEQLSIKYRISPRESSRFWIRFNTSGLCSFDSIQRLFGSDSEPSGPMGEDMNRSSFWVGILGLSGLSDTDNISYSKYVSELEFTASVSKITDSIWLDVVRTHQELALFQQDDVRNKLRNILNVYCTLNGVEYVQGMNELLAVVFFVVREESTSFWVFTAIMGQMKDLFTMEVDSTSDGVYSRIDYIWLLLRKHDYTLCKHLRKIEFPMTTMGVRWLTTLLATDVTMPDVVQIWDSVLQSLKGGNLVTFAACMITAYIIEMGDSLLVCDDVAAVEVALSFGKGNELDLRHFTNSAMSIYAFEIFLAEKYEPTSDEPLMDIVADVVDSAKTRVVAALGADSLNIAHERLESKLEEAGNAIGSWFGYTKSAHNIDSTEAALDKLP